MKVGVLAYKSSIKNTDIAAMMTENLRDWGYQTVIFSSPAEIVDVDVVIILGGDGAILHSAIHAAKRKIKIIGINYGNLGFLTEYEKDEWQKVKELLSAFERGDCRILKRSVLEITVEGKRFYALNEMSVLRDSGFSAIDNPQILRMEVRSTEGVNRISGDGVLICTPTGSTAYSLSAGGAILTPEVPVFMMTPVCAFSMRARPTVFSDNEQFILRITRGRATLSLDGRALIVIGENMQIQVKKAPFTADFPVKGNTDFFEKVNNKLNE